MEEKKQIGQLFDRIAGTYDRFNHVLSMNIDRRWRREAVKRLQTSQRAASIVLDVAVGTGDMALEILRQRRAEQVVGIDVSSEMMRLGEKKAARKGVAERIIFQQESALDMPFADGQFDAVTCAYGIRNFSDLEKGLSEMYRVLCKGGQVIILEFSYPTARFVRCLYDFFFTRIMPVVGRKISKDDSAYIYFRDSVKHFIWGEEMAKQIAKVGFEDVCFKTLTFGITTIYTAKK